MNIVNPSERYFKTEQLEKFLKLFNKKYVPSTLIIYERRWDLFKNFRPIGLSFLPILLGKTEGFYNPNTDTICLFVFSENDDGDDMHSFQLYTLHALCHEMRHRFQELKNRPSSEEDADSFATAFINQYSKVIMTIMEWEDEWEVEEY